MFSGEKEMAEGSLSLRGRHGVQLGSGSISEVLAALGNVVETRSLDLTPELLDLELPPAKAKEE